MNGGIIGYRMWGSISTHFREFGLVRDPGIPDHHCAFVQIQCLRSGPGKILGSEICPFSHKKLRIVLSLNTSDRQKEPVWIATFECKPRCQRKHGPRLTLQEGTPALTRVGLAGTGKMALRTGASMPKIRQLEKWVIERKSENAATITRSLISVSTASQNRGCDACPVCNYCGSGRT